MGEGGGGVKDIGTGPPFWAFGEGRGPIAPPPLRTHLEMLVLKFSIFWTEPLKSRKVVFTYIRNECHIHCPIHGHLVQLGKLREGDLKIDRSANRSRGAESCTYMGIRSWRIQTFAMGGTPSGGPPNFSRPPNFNFLPGFRPLHSAI